MKVKLAAQVFSQCFHAALFTLVYSRDLPSEAADTAEFVRKVDNLFDCFNSESDTFVHNVQMRFALGQCP